MHNHIRNSIHFITSQLGPHAGFIPNEQSCRWEERGLLPNYPTLRPGDETLHKTTNPLEEVLSQKPPIIALDCAIIGKKGTKNKNS